MENKLDFLKKYNKDVIIYATEQILELEEIPLEWKEIFKCNSEEQVKKIIEMWEKIVGNEMKLTISYLKENLLEVDLISFKDIFRLEKHYSIIYSIKDPNNEIGYYSGEIPYKSKEEFEWMKTKESLKDFYTKLHNGFYYYASESVGLVPIRSLTYFKDYDWGILDDLKEPLQINLDETIGFFSSGMGGYVAIDIKNNHSVLWFSYKQPEYNISFWSFVDAWTKIGMEM